MFYELQNAYSLSVRIQFYLYISWLINYLKSEKFLSNQFFLVKIKKTLKHARQLGENKNLW